jgi:hypothetical protein
VVSSQELPRTASVSSQAPQVDPSQALRARVCARGLMPSYQAMLNALVSNQPPPGWRRKQGNEKKTAAEAGHARRRWLQKLSMYA